MLKEVYKKVVIPKMRDFFKYKNDLAVPRIIKTVVNVGFGKILGGLDPSKNKPTIQSISNDLMLICGQKPILTKAKKAISGFKARKGSIVGAKVTFRGNRAYDFLERLINTALPRSRDFRGIPLKAIDKGGNLTIGVKEHLIFPEIQPEKSKVPFGLEITIVTNARTREEALNFFRLIGLPLKKEEKSL